MALRLMKANKSALAFLMRGREAVGGAWIVYFLGRRLEAGHSCSSFGGLYGSCHNVPVGDNHGAELYV
jgi:hypothetical protein